MKTFTSENEEHTESPFNDEGGNESSKDKGFENEAFTLCLWQYHQQKKELRKYKLFEAPTSHLLPNATESFKQLKAQEPSIVFWKKDELLSVGALHVHAIA